MNNESQRYIAEDEIDLRELFRTIKKRKYLILIITLTITILAGVYAFMKTPMYEAKALVEIGNYKDPHNNNNNAVVLLHEPSQLSQKLNVIFIDANKNGIDKDSGILSISVPKGSKNFIEITSLAISNELAIDELNSVIDSIQDEENLILQNIRKTRELEIKNIDTQISNIKHQDGDLIENKITLQNERLQSTTKQLKYITDNLNGIFKINPTLGALLIMQQNNISNTIYKIKNNIIDLKNKKETQIVTSVNQLNEKKNIIKSLLLPYNYKNSHVVAEIITNDYPVKPKKTLIVVVAFVTGLILSIFLVFFLEFISNNKNDD